MNLKDVDSRKAFLIKRYDKGEPLTTLNVGCGNLHIENAINFDASSEVNPDVIGDFHFLPFKDGKFETVFAFDIIEHTNYPEVLLAELERVGKNVVIECLDFDHCPIDWKEDETHITYFNKEIFNKLLSDRGYKCFVFRKHMLVAVKKPRLFDKQLCFLYCFFRKVLKGINSFINQKGKK